MQNKAQLANENVKPYYEPLRKHPIHLESFIDSEIDKLVKFGIVEECAPSEWCSNLVIVKRRTLPGQSPRLRVTVDLRGTNLRLKRLQYPMPDAQSVLNGLQGHRYFSTIDFCNAYFAVGVHEAGTEFLTFKREKEYSDMFVWLTEFLVVRLFSLTWFS